MWRGIDKRKFPRASYKCRVNIKKGGASSAFNSVTENLGVGGICVVLDKQLDIFENVDLELALDDKTPPIKSKGSVVWVVRRSSFDKNVPSRYDTGIEFIDIKDEDVARIDAIVNEIYLKELDKPQKP